MASIARSVKGLSGLTQRCVAASSIAGRRAFSEAAFDVSRPAAAQVRDSTQIGTRQIFTPEHDMFRETVRKFFAEQCEPYHAQWEKDGQASREVWLAAGEQGLLGADCPEAYGGSESGIITASIVWEEQGYSGHSALGFILHSDIVVPYLLNYGTEEQKQKLIPKLVSGEHIGAIAMSEPSAGSDLAGVKSTAVKDGDDYILNGSKTFITNGAMADTVIVVAKTDPKKGAHGVSLFVVEEGMEGFTRGRKLNKMGMKGQDTSELFFDNVRLPKSALLGEENKGFMMLMQELPQERLLIAGGSAASCEAMFEMTRKYCKERKAFGSRLIDQQLIRHKLANLKTEIAVGRAFYDQCLELHSRKKLDPAMACMAKAHLTDLQGKVADACVQLHGGYGYMWEYPICRAYADARVQRIYGGTNEIMMELVSRTL